MCSCKLPLLIFTADEILWSTKSTIALANMMRHGVGLLPICLRLCTRKTKLHNIISLHSISLCSIHIHSDLILFHHTYWNYTLQSFGNPVFHLHINSILRNLYLQGISRITIYFNILTIHYKPSLLLLVFLCSIT